MRVLGPEIIRRTVETIDKIRARIKAAQDQQKSYADTRRKDLEFKILDRVENVTYRLALPPRLSTPHNVFHVSMIKKYMHVPNHVVNYQSVEVQKDLSYENVPIRILDRK
ncbi:uncharacterized protein LOC111386818, partial [Olea europaea var. sylvestris]|uniref:uncharacterized protein LOC111386818 n=1 Tax=Olea europaea var. sylvestris TaxID=158386 RepID=UPI000C1D5F54